MANSKDSRPFVVARKYAQTSKAGQSGSMGGHSGVITVWAENALEAKRVGAKQLGTSVNNVDVGHSDHMTPGFSGDELDAMNNAAAEGEELAKRLGLDDDEATGDKNLDLMKRMSKG